MAKRMLGLKLKAVVLVILIGLTAHFSFQLERTAAADCQRCVFPEGGICVGCSGYGAPSDTAYNSCTPVQASCSCNVSGGTCTLPCKFPGQTSDCAAGDEFLN